MKPAAIAAIFTLGLLAAACAGPNPDATIARTQLTTADQLAAAQINIPDGDKIICREDTMTGQRIAGRVCHTKREWYVLENDAGDFIKRTQDTGLKLPQP